VFGKRSGPETETRATKPAADALEPASAAAPAVPRSAPPPPAIASPPLSPAKPAPPVIEARRSDHYYQVKATIFGALIEAIDLAQLAKLDGESAREEIRDIVNEIISIKAVVMSIAEQEHLLQDICNDVLGYGPLEPLLARDDIAHDRRAKIELQSQHAQKIAFPIVRAHRGQRKAPLAVHAIGALDGDLDGVAARSMQHAPAKILPRAHGRAVERSDDVALDQPCRRGG